MFGAATQNGVGIGLGNIPTLTSLPYNVQLNLAVQQLFASGEPGFWLDPSDLSTMYQDSAGTTPVTAVEQPVGLILDKSQGLVLGAEVITPVANQNFSSDTGFWQKETGWAITGGFAVATNAATSYALRKDPLLVANTYYQVTFTIVSISAGALRIYASGNYSASFSTPGTYTLRILNGSGTNSFQISALGTTTATVSYISAKPVLGTHYYQSTAGVRPVLSARYNQLVGTEFKNGVTDAPTRGGLLSATTLTGYGGALAFGYDGSTTSYAYQNASSTNGPGTLSVVVQMTDGNAPTFGSGSASSSANSFALVVGGNPVSPLTYSVAPLTNSCYRVTLAVGTFTATLFAGIAKYNTNDNRTFKVTAYDCRPSDQATGLIPTYQRVNTSTDYDTAGFPLYLSGNGTQWMQCAAQDYTGVNKMLVCAGVRKLSDAALGVITELSANYGSNNGTFYVGAGASSAARYGFGAKATKYAGYEPATFAAPITNVLSCAYDLSTATQASQIQPRINGTLNQTNGFVEAGGPTTGAFGNYAAYLFSRAGATNFFTGNIYQLIARGSTVASNAAQIAATESWVDLKTKAY